MEGFIRFSVISALVMLYLACWGLNACKVICEGCLDCCDKFHGEAYLSGEGHTLSLRRKRRHAGLAETVPATDLPQELVKISGDALMPVCDGNEDESVSWTEYELCTTGMAGPRAMQRKFNTLDVNGDQILSAEELRPVAIKMTGAVDCYDAMVTSCASQFVAYQRARQISTTSFCRGFKFYSSCISRGTPFCTDSRTDRLVATLASASNVISDVCSPSALSSEAVTECAHNLLAELHGRVPPCSAMRNFKQCLHLVTQSDPDVRLPFTEVVEDVSCL